MDFVKFIKFLLKCIFAKNTLIYTSIFGTSLITVHTFTNQVKLKISKKNISSLYRIIIKTRQKPQLNFIFRENACITP